jgi:steroid delta-isomerase-like uncharacterized protein
MSAEQNKAIITRWVEDAWNGGDFSSVPSTYVPDYTLNDVSLPKPINRREELADFIATFRRGMPDLRMTIDQYVAEGETVAWRFHVEGTQTGELFGAPASGRRIHTAGVVISCFENGLWKEDYSFWDVMTMLRQMGVIPETQPR